MITKLKKYNEDIKLYNLITAPLSIPLGFGTT